MSIPQGGTYNLKVWQNASFEQVFSLREPGGVTPINLSAYTARAQIRARSRAMGVRTPIIAGALYCNLTCVVDGAAGDITVSALPAATALVLADGVWSLEITDGTNTYVLIEGLVTVHPEVTTP